MNRELIKTFINEVLRVSSGKTEKMKKNRGIKLMRVGGLSKVKQTNSSAPEKRGVWAFIWPYAELFLLSSTNHRGISDRPTDDQKQPETRISQLKREGFREFYHSGKIYTRFNVPGSRVSRGGDWYETTGEDLSAYMPRFYSKLNKEYKSSKIEKSSPTKAFSRDMFEVFVPDPE